MFLAHFSVILYLVFFICDFDELRIVKKNLYTCVFFSITYSFIFIYYDIHLFRTLIFNKHFNTDCHSTLCPDLTHFLRFILNVNFFIF